MSAKPNPTKLSPYDPDGGGWTLLHFAAAEGRREVALFLIHHGLDVNAVTNEGMTPLQIAIRCHAKEEIVKQLLKRGANPNIKDQDGCTPLMDAVLASRPYWSAYAINIARLLLKHGAEVDATNNNSYTAVSLAICINAKNIAKFLIKIGADSDI